MASFEVCRVDDIEPGAAKRFDVDGHRIAVVRVGGDFYAIGDRCSHADYSLAEGEVDEEALTLECWKHGSTFDLTTGEPTVFPATRAVPVYEVEVREGSVVVTA